MPLRPAKRPAKRHDNRKPSATRRLYDRRWNKNSHQFLANNPLCRPCQLFGQHTPAVHTDHIIPHEGNTALFSDPRNWQPICKTCHDLKTWREAKGCVVTWKPRPERMVISGLPGCGKSYLVAQHAAADARDIVHDWPSGQLSANEEMKQLCKQNELVELIVASTHRPRCWLVVPDSLPAYHIAARISATLVHVWVDENVRQARLAERC